MMFFINLLLSSLLSGYFLYRSTDLSFAFFYFFVFVFLLVYLMLSGRVDAVHVVDS